MTNREEERELWANVAASFATTSIDQAINSLLKKLGELHGIDRVFFIRFEKRLKNYSMTHEWNHNSDSFIIQNIQGQPFYKLFSAYAKIQASNEFIVDDVRKLSQRDAALKRELMKYDVHATAMLPVNSDTCMGGLIGYSHGNTRKWNVEEIEMLRCSAKILSRILMKGNTPHFFLERAKYTKAIQSPDAELFPFQDISRIQSDRNYSKVVMHDGKVYAELRSLTEWLKILPSGVFLRIHRSHIINVAHAHKLIKIDGVCKIELEKEGISIPVGRIYRQNLKKVSQNH